MFLKNKEKGSVTLFVLVGCTFTIMILLLANMGLINEISNNNKQINEIIKKYSVNESNLEQEYQKLVNN